MHFTPATISPQRLMGVTVATTILTLAGIMPVLAHAYRQEVTSYSVVLYRYNPNDAEHRKGLIESPPEILVRRDGQIEFSGMVFNSSEIQVPLERVAALQPIEKREFLLRAQDGVLLQAVVDVLSRARKASINVQNDSRMRRANPGLPIVLVYDVTRMPAAPHPTAPSQRGNIGAPALTQRSRSDPNLTFSP